MVCMGLVYLGDFVGYARVAIPTQKYRAGCQKQNGMFSSKSCMKRISSESTSTCSWYWPPSFGNGPPPEPVRRWVSASPLPATLCDDSEACCATPRAIALHEQFLPAIESIERTLGTATAFDSKTTERRFRIGIPGAVDVCLTAPLIARLRRLAPVAALTVRQADVTNGQDLIETEAVDLALSVFYDVRSGIVKQEIGQAGYSCIYDSERRRGQPISLNEYVRAGHVLTSFSGDHKGVVDTALAKLKRKRRIVVATQEFSSVPFYLHGTDLIATLPTYAARVYARRLRLEWSPLPFPMPRLTLSLLWHARFTSDAGHAWFRNLVRTIAQQTLLRD
jgi:LysR family transcriptional activator of mexEF-oprN operon